MTKKFFFLGFSLLFALSSQGSIVINEVMPKNICSSVDDNFQFSSWAELYNSGAEDVDVSSYFLSDTSAISDKWRLSDEDAPSKLIVKPGEFLVIFLDASTEDPLPLHASFKLPAKKGTLYLFDDSGRQIDRMSYDTTYRNISYGRLEDGSKSLGFFLTPTPGASNNGVETSSSQTPAPSFSLTPGFYSGEQTVSLSDEDGSAEIYYTTDGSEPTKEKGTIYEDPIQITKNTPLRAAAYKKGQIPSNVVSATYFVDEREISLPVVSIVSDPEYVTGDDLGLFVAGWNGAVVPSYCNGPDYDANYMNDWDRPANFEFFDLHNKKERLNQEVKIGNFGACSRTKYVKSIKVNAAKIYGDNELDYPIFKEKPNLRWKSVVLRNSGNDFGRSYLRDGFLQTAASCLDIDHQAYQPSAVFLNGEYYGMLNIRERTNKDFIFSNYGLDEDEFFLNEGSHADEGTTYEMVLNYANMSDDVINAPGRYEEIDNVIDVNECLNYFLSEIYVVNRDWPGGNIKAWKPRDGGRWRWILYDTDFGFSLYEQNYTSRSISLYANKCETFKGLMKNNKIKNRFLAKCYVHLATTFSAERMNAILDSLLNNVQAEAKYYEEYLDSKHKKEGSFDDNISSIRTFVNRRVPYIYKDIKSVYKVDSTRMRIFSSVESAKFSLNDEPINVNDFSGLYFMHTPTNIEAIVPAGFLFDHWEVIRDGKKETLYDPVICDTACAESYEAFFLEDASYDPDVNRILFNEICTKNSVYLDEFRQQEDWIELYNSGSVDVDLAGMYLSNSIDTLDMYQFPSDDPNNTVVRAGGYKIIWADKDPEQGSLHADFKLPFSESRSLFLSVKNNDGSFEILDSVTYQLHERHHSYARFVAKGKPYWSATNMVTFSAKNHLPTDVPDVLAEEFHLSLYPNPVSHSFSLISSSECAMDVKVVSLTGTIVSEARVKNNEPVSLETAENGIYLVFVNSDAGNAVLKIIKK